MIYPYTISCYRDAGLYEQLCNSIPFYSEPYVMFDVAGYENGSGWEASMIKVRGLQHFNFINDDDYVMSVDSDVLFTREYTPKNVGIQGIESKEPFPDGFKHFSGCCMFLRGDVVKKINKLKDADFIELREHLKKHNIIENEDVILSYLADLVDAERIAVDLLCDNSKAFFEGKETTGNIIHFNLEGITEYLGYPVTGKWDIHNAIKKYYENN